MNSTAVVITLIVCATIIVLTVLGKYDNGKKG